MPEGRRLRRGLRERDRGHLADLADLADLAGTARFAEPSDLDKTRRFAGSTGINEDLASTNDPTGLGGTAPVGRRRARARQYATQQVRAAPPGRSVRVAHGHRGWHRWRPPAHQAALPPVRHGGITGTPREHDDLGRGSTPPVM